MDSDLLEELRASFEKVGHVEMLEQDDAICVLERIAKKFVDDKSRVYWWESLKVPIVTHCYDGSDGLSILSGVISHLEDVYLVVTDDEPSPWPVFEVAAKNIVSTLQSCRSFEYFVVGIDLSWVVFDTHLNQLIYTSNEAK